MELAVTLYTDADISCSVDSLFLARFIIKRGVSIGYIDVNADLRQISATNKLGVALPLYPGHHMGMVAARLPKKETIEEIDDRQLQQAVVLFDVNRFSGAVTPALRQQSLGSAHIGSRFIYLEAQACEGRASDRLVRDRIAPPGNFGACAGVRRSIGSSNRAVGDASA